MLPSRFVNYKEMVLEYQQLVQKQKGHKTLKPASRV